VPTATPEAEVIATAPAADVFKKWRREDWVIWAPSISNEFIADPQMKNHLKVVYKIG
jgi:hypothetical protein